MASALDDTPRDARYGAIFCDEGDKEQVAILAHDLSQGTDPKKRWAAAEELIESYGQDMGQIGCNAFAEALTDSDADYALRMEASKSLAVLGPVAGDTGARALAKTLCAPDNDSFLRSCTASSIGKLGAHAGKVGVLALGKAMETDEDVYVRRTAAAALGEIGPKIDVRAAERAAVPSLTKALQDSDVTVRWRAAESIGTMGSFAGDAGAAALAKAVREDADVGTRRRAAASLGQLEETAGGHVAALYEAYHNDSHAIVREHANDSMKRIKKASIAAFTSSEHEYIRGRAAWAIGEMSEFAGDEAIAILLKALFQEPDIYVRRRALEAIGKLGKHVGEVGAAALAQARFDTDCFISANAREIYDGLGIEATDVCMYVSRQNLYQMLNMEPPKGATAADATVLVLQDPGTTDKEPDAEPTSTVVATSGSAPLDETEALGSQPEADLPAG